MKTIDSYLVELWSIARTTLYIDVLTDLVAKLDSINIADLNQNELTKVTNLRYYIEGAVDMHLRKR